MKTLLLVPILAAGCVLEQNLGDTTATRNNPCDTAHVGDACRWAGTGNQGFDLADPEPNRLESLLDDPIDMTFGPDGRAYLVDWNNHMIRRVDADQRLRLVIGTTWEGDGAPDAQDMLPRCAPHGAPGTTLSQNHPGQARFGTDGLLYIAAAHNDKIRTFDPATGLVRTFAGEYYGFSGDGGQACQAMLNQPSAIAVDDGNIYVVDQHNVRIRVIRRDGTIDTIAGAGLPGNSGDGGPAKLADLGFSTTSTALEGALVVYAGYLYVADSPNHRIRRIDLETGIIACVAGCSGQAGYAGDGGPALAAMLHDPIGLAVGPDDRLYVADTGNNVVRAIDLKSKLITTVVGNGTICDTSIGVCPGRAAATAMPLHEPHGVAFDAAGNLYVVDTMNHRIVKVIR